MMKQQNKSIPWTRFIFFVLIALNSCNRDAKSFENIDKYEREFEEDYLAFDATSRLICELGEEVWGDNKYLTFKEEKTIVERVIPNPQILELMRELNTKEIIAKKKSYGISIDFILHKLNPNDKYAVWIEYNNQNQFARSEPNLIVKKLKDRWYLVGYLGL